MRSSGWSTPPARSRPLRSRRSCGARSRELESQANTDALTGLGNLRHLQRQLAQLLDLHKRYDHPFGVLLMDVDGLKRINDSHGHRR